jgi:hypothetical protein
MSQHGSGAHLADGELMQLALGDTEDLVAALQRHVAGCTLCTDELTKLRAQMQRVSGALRELQLPAEFRYPTLAMPKRINWQPYLRAAAIVLFAAVPVVASETVRARISEWIGLQTADTTAATVAAPATQTSEDVSTTFWFNPRAREYSVQIASYQVRGELVISRTSEANGMLRMSNVGAPAPQLSERGVRIANSPSTFTTYELMLPANVTAAIVTIGAGPVQRIDLRELSSPAVIQLRNAGE